MAVPYQPLAIANEFIARSGPAGAEHMKIQKLVYVSYGWWLAYYDTPLCSEQPEVWMHGPVFSSLYAVLKPFGRASITTLQQGPFSPPPRVDDADEKVLGLIEWIWARYGSRSAFYLSDLTHQPGSPWHQVASEHGFRVPKHTKIPNEIISKHYKDLAVERGFEAA